MNDDAPVPANPPPTIRIQQTAERVEGDARIIGLNVTIDEVNVQINLPQAGEQDEHGKAPTRIVMEVSDPATEILPLLETWLKALLGANVRIVVERDDERE